VYPGCVGGYIPRMYTSHHGTGRHIYQEGTSHLASLVVYNRVYLASLVVYNRVYLASQGCIRGGI